MSKSFAGIIVPIVTPFDERENFDPAALGTLIEFLLSSGVHGIFPIGSVGEFYALDTDEIKQIIRATVRAVNGRVPVIAGTGAVDTRRSIRLSQYAQEVGADAVTILTPFYIQPNEDELFRHYSEILKAVSIPVLGYSNPGRSGGISLTPALVRRLAEQYAHFAGMKDSSGNMALLKDYIRAAPPDFAVFTGMDSIIFEAVLDGARGAVAGLANFAPRLAVEVYDRTRSGDYDAARIAQAKLERLRATYSLGTFPAVTKAAARMVGLPVGATRLPVGAPGSEAEARLRAALVEVLGAEALDQPYRAQTI
ncbi:MAG: 4-hydroxy-tetrahydrodipicolinate synthase [Anaerolineae bacterium]|nr:4-hydroxy-tetrahydrodipicolinate synthase [Anaerolineae bacterium]